MLKPFGTAWSRHLTTWLTQQMLRPFDRGFKGSCESCLYWKIQSLDVGYFTVCYSKTLHNYNTCSISINLKAQAKLSLLFGLKLSCTLSDSRRIWTCSNFSWESVVKSFLSFGLRLMVVEENSLNKQQMSKIKVTTLVIKSTIFRKCKLIKKSKQLGTRLLCWKLILVPRSSVSFGHVV